ncbi:MAG: BamA/TamA family outer membrane protein [bacterium]
MTSRSLLYSLLFFGLISLVHSSCTVVRHFPENKPFHFENNIKIDGKVSREQKVELKTRLLSQIEDSAQVRAASKIPWPSFPWFIPVSVIEHPSLFNKEKVDESALNMKNALKSVGFRKAEIETDTTISKRGKQYRVYTSYIIRTGPMYKIDTIVYQFTDSSLQQIAIDNARSTGVKKGKGFDYTLIDEEINRLTNIFQTNGYYKIDKEDIIAEVDTNYTELMDASLDPFENARAIALAKKRITDPKVDIAFKLRENRDSTHLARYKVGSMTVYPDLTELDDAEDILAVHKDSTRIKIHSLHNTFNKDFILSNILLKPGAIFNRNDYSKTLNNFNKLGAWQNINVNSEADDVNKEINYLLKLQPAKRQFFSIDLEGSSIINTSQLIQIGSGRVGAATNFTLRNRNIGKRAIQLENTLRTGVEFNNFQKLLSGEIALTNRLTFPWLVAPLNKTTKSRFQQARTIISADFSYVDRFRFFRINSVNTFLGYEWKPKPNVSWLFRPINIEFTQFRPDSLFLESIQDFPLLLYTYNNGLIIGMNATFNYNLTPNNAKRISLLKIFAEESGLLTGNVFSNQTKPGKSLSNLYKYIKADAEFKQIFVGRNSSLHLRAYGGAGFAFNTGSRTGQVTLPFFKSFIAGGPNSMRGWPIRKLGIGSNVFYDTVSAGTFNDKYADIQLEANLEYRFNLFQFYGFWMRGAVFTDIGNIWFRNELDGTLKNANFKFNKLGNDIAIASGFGARVDFNYFLLRFDLGFPIKDPRYGPDKTGNATIERFYSPRAGGWLVNNVWNKPSFQFALGYPF